MHTHLSNISLQNIACLLISLGMIADCDAQTPEFNDIRQQWLDCKSWYGKKYVYKIHLEDTSTDEQGSYLKIYKDALLRDGIRELVTGVPVKSQTAIPIRMIQRIDNPGEPHLETPMIISVWQGSDGKETRTFFRRLNYAADKVNRSEGKTLRGAVVDIVLEDPFFIALFGSLQARFMGTALPEKVVPIVGITIKPAKHPAVDTAFEVVSPASFGEKNTIISDGPEYLVLSRERQGTKLDVSEVREFDGVRYPAKGYYECRIWRGTFELLEVSVIDPKLEKWHLDFPTGSQLTTYQTRDVKSIPYTTSEHNLILDHVLNNRRSKPAQGYSGFAILTTTLVVVLGVLAAIRYRTALRGQV